MTSRLSLALAGDHVGLPEAGPVLFLRPGGGHDFGGLEMSRVVAVQGFYPDHAALKRRGVPVVTAFDGAIDGPCAAAVVTLPKAKAQAFALLAEAMAALPAGAPIVVDGAKGDGVDSILKACRKVLEVGPPYSKAHGKVFTVTVPDAIPEGWAAADAEVEGFVTRAGVFSADGVDAGSAALVAALPPMKGTVCDLGAGWGYLTVQVLAANPSVISIDMVEAEQDALSCAVRNVSDARAKAHWADARDWTGRYDWVISNPPFHIGRQTAPELGQAFIARAAKLVAPRGTFIMVANRHLPYEATLRDSFAEVVVLSETGGYKVVSGKRPTGTTR